MQESAGGWLYMVVHGFGFALVVSLSDFLGGGAHPPNFIRAPPPPPTCFAPPNIYLHPPNIFAPYPRNFSIRGQAAYVPPNYSFLQLQTTPVLTFLMLSGTF